LAILFQPLSGRRERAKMNRNPGGMALFGPAGRKYLNANERRRFLAAADRANRKVRLFCLMLSLAGCRISEALALTSAAIDLDSGVVTFETLKRRKRGVIRQVPLPSALLHDLNGEFGLRAAQGNPDLRGKRLWLWSRTTAWRHVKGVLRAAGISGTPAMPKGLRHAFGVSAFASVPPHIVQRWLGHASLRTTSIYGDVSGREERQFAARMWRRW
jgi:integrase